MYESAVIYRKLGGKKKYKKKKGVGLKSDVSGGGGTHFSRWEDDASRRRRNYKNTFFCGPEHCELRTQQVRSVDLNLRRGE